MYANQINTMDPSEVDTYYRKARNALLEANSYLDVALSWSDDRNFPYRSGQGLKHQQEIEKMKMMNHELRMMADYLSDQWRKVEDERGL